MHCKNLSYNHVSINIPVSVPRLGASLHTQTWCVEPDRICRELESFIPTDTSQQANTDAICFVFNKQRVH